MRRAFIFVGVQLISFVQETTTMAAPPPPPPPPQIPAAAHLFANMRAPRVAAANVPVDPLGFVQPKTPAQIQALMANPDYKPPLTDFFDNTLHPENLDRHGNPVTNLQQANVAMALIRRVLETCIHGSIIRNPMIATNFRNYISCFIRGMIVTIILHMAYGWQGSLRANQQSIDTIIQWLQYSSDATDADRTYFLTWVQPYINYLWNWMIPPNHPYASFPKVQKYKFKTFRDNISRGAGANAVNGRLMFPIWSNNYILGQRITRGMSSICNGHFREYFLMVDLVLRGFRDKAQAREFFVLPGESVTAALQAQANSRLYTE
jgi:hypothetical protein